MSAAKIKATTKPTTKSAPKRGAPVEAGKSGGPVLPPAPEGPQSVLLVGPLTPVKLLKHFRGEGWEETPDFVVAIDGGLDVCKKARFKPDFAIGDWDSLSSRALLKEIPHVTLPSAKNESDLAAALAWLESTGRASQILAAGVTGGRADHHLASLQELSNASVRIPICAFGDDGQYIFLSPVFKNWSVRARRNTILSAFAFGDSAQGVTLEGFEYPLKGATLQPGSRGLSNRTQATEGSVSITSGRLLVMLPTSKPKSKPKR